MFRILEIDFSNTLTFVLVTTYNCSIDPIYDLINLLLAFSKNSFTPGNFIFRFAQFVGALIE